MKPIYLLGAAVTVCASTSALADTQRHQGVSDSPFTGPYVGVYGGYDWSELETGGIDPDLDGWDGGVFVGGRVDGLLNRVDGVGIGMNGAVEAFYGVSNSDDSVGTTGYEKDDEWGVSFRPGFSFIDKAVAPVGLNPYGIIGYRNTKFDSSTGGSDRYNGFDLGVGTEVLAFGNYGIRAEYSHVWYASKNNIDPESDNLRIGASYHF